MQRKKPYCVLGVRLLADASVVLALASTYAAKIESQGAHSCITEHTADGHDQAVGHVSAEARVWMAYGDARKRSPTLGKMQDPLKGQRAALEGDVLVAD